MNSTHPNMGGTDLAELLTHLTDSPQSMASIAARIRCSVSTISTIVKANLTEIRKTPHGICFAPVGEKLDRVAVRAAPYLGRMVDRAVAEIIGCGQEQVRRVRIAAGIKPYRKRGPMGERSVAGSWALVHDYAFTAAEYAQAIGVDNRKARELIRGAECAGDLKRLGGDPCQWVTP